MFKWNPSEHVTEDGKKISELMDENTLVYIHLSSDDHMADLMEYDKLTGEYSVLRMVPPIPVKYYFSIA